MRKFFLFLPFLFSSSCSNPCKGPDNVPLISLPQDVRDYGVFAPGSYWIYMNDSTQQTDSVAVISTKLDTFSIEQGCMGGVMHYFPISYYEEFNVTLSPPLFGAGVTLKSQSEHIILHGTLSGAALIFNPDDTSSGSWLDSLEVAGTIYYDVYIGRNNSSPLDSYKNAFYYSSRNFGIIKKEIFVSADNIESWSLIKSHIIQ